MPVFFQAFFLLTLAHLVARGTDAQAFTVDVDEGVSRRNIQWLVETTTDIATLVNFDHCNYSDPRLARLARPLGFRYIRIGGTQGDFTFYNLTHDTPAFPLPPAPKGFKKVLYRDVWLSIAQFAQETGLQIFFGLNAGLSSRNATPPYAWLPTLAETMIEFNVRHNLPVVGYEFSNEPNLLAILEQPGDDSATTSSRSPGESVAWATGARWAADMATFRSTLDGFNASLVSVCCDVAYVPLLGELYPFMDEFVANGGLNFTSAVTYHFYPLIGEHASIAKLLPPALDPFNATAIKLTWPIILDQIGYWTRRLENTLRGPTPEHARQLPTLWLGETGSVVGGGQEGVSDRFVDSMEYVDKIGQLALLNVTRMFRQTLCGSSDQYYALISHDLQPRPTYFTTLLVRQVVGNATYSVSSTTSTRNGSTSSSTDLRVYAFAHPDRAAHKITFAVINLGNTSEFADFCLSSGLSNATIPRLSADYEVYELTPGGPDRLNLAARTVRLNGVELHVDAEGAPPMLAGKPQTWLLAAAPSTATTCYRTAAPVPPYAVWFAVSTLE